MQVGDLQQIESWAASSVSEGALSATADRRGTVLTARNTRRLLELARHLPEADRALVRAVYGDGTPIRVVAGLRRQPDRECRRRLALLVDRMNHPAFAVAVHGSAPIRGRGARIARACFVEGLTIRQAAVRLRTSVYAVRRERARILAMVQCLKLADHLSRAAARRAA